MDELRSYPRAIREAQTSVLDVTKGEDDISWKRIRSVRHLTAQTDKGSTFEHIEMKVLWKTRVPKTDGGLDSRLS
jgi:hypothetical protein